MLDKNKIGNISILQNLSIILSENDKFSLKECFYRVARYYFGKELDSGICEYLSGTVFIPALDMIFDESLVISSKTVCSFLKKQYRDEKILGNRDYDYRYSVNVKYGKFDSTSLFCSVVTDANRSILGNFNFFDVDSNMGKGFNLLNPPKYVKRNCELLMDFFQENVFGLMDMIEEQ